MADDGTAVSEKVVGNLLSDLHSHLHMDQEKHTVKYLIFMLLTVK